MEYSVSSVLSFSLFPIIFINIWFRIPLAALYILLRVNDILASILVARVKILNMATWLLFCLKNNLGNQSYLEVKTAELEDAALAKAQILGVIWMF